MASLNMKEALEKLEQLVKQGDAEGMEKVVEDILAHLKTQLSGEQLSEKEAIVRNRCARVKKMMELESPVSILENEINLLKEAIE